ncbi:dethiobiotin synthase [Flammeovirga pacifica]|uniref:ATP-dependent dethiobiotin synthetase BioD n=1 Tax=Flammeovirga pacifica TaxID=915059 RepID=A0A1S1YVF9_FLAPC|nr:dethiobiotin synthase [Flammeovirga pacifica]OHX64990.1 dethiobiotin synthase [Flammeovirga pacifica]
MEIFITAIGTDSGKSIVSSILTEALDADYWKPVQAGYPTDTDTVHSLLYTPKEKLPEAYLLEHPMSPHAAAALENRVIQLEDIQLPKYTKEHLVVEGAGGIMVPLNDENMVIDIPQKLGLGVVLVSNIYLGNINHTLLSINELKRRGLPLVGIVFNGDNNEATKSIILKHANCPELFHLPTLEKVDKESIYAFANQLKENLRTKLFQNA